MPLNKFAGFGTAPFDALLAPGLGTVLAENRASAAGLHKIALEIHKLNVVMQGGPGDTIDPPSATAVAIVVSLGDQFDWLCDHDTTLDQLNERLAGAWRKKSNRVKDAYAYLSDLPDLAAGYARLFAPLDDPNAEFEPQRRRRIAETVAFEWQVLSEVDDADESQAGALA
jgi:hypothetical protein